MEQAIKKDDRAAGIILIFLRPHHKTTPSANFDKFLLSPSFDFAKVLNIRRKNRDVCVL